MISRDCLVGKCGACSAAVWDTVHSVPAICACGCHTPTDTFRVVWPITDDEQTRAQLEQDARADLPDLLFKASLRAVETPRFSIAWDEDGKPQLVAELGVRPWVDPVRHARRRAVS